MNERQFNEITEWQRNTFRQATALSKIEHLKEEIKELEADIESNAAEKRFEFADCFMLLFGAAACEGMTYHDIVSAIEEKFTIIRTRKWGKPDEKGVVKHIKE